MTDHNNNKLKRKIVKYFSANKKKAFNYKQIAAAIDADDTKSRNEIIRLLKILEKEGSIEELTPGKYMATYVSQFLEGRIQVTQRGIGYVLSEDGNTQDVLIERDGLNTALDGDMVKIHLYAGRQGERPSGEVIEIIKRNRMEFAGVVQLSATYAFVVPDDKRMYTDIYVPLPKLNKAKHGEKVLVKITEWTTEHKNPIGEITEVLGKPGTHHTEMHAIIAEFGFATRFPEAVEAESKKIPEKISADEIKKRKDFRETLTFTIDPEDAKDFDDAISFKPMPDGKWEVGVHIADVSHYVTEESKLDEEAYNRATSVYLVDRTIPMLPEKLSNGVCSLRPHEEKLTFSAVFVMNEKAEILNKWIGKTVIYSQRRFSYEEAQQRIETGEGDLAVELHLLNEMAKKLREKRFKSGAVNFETEEVKFKLDDQFKPMGIFKKVRKDAHKLIEEFMLLANRTVAQYVYELAEQKQKKTFVYRVHESPSEDKLRQFSAFAGRFGYRIQTNSQKAIAHSFNELLKEVEGKPEQNIIQSMAVRSMMKAYYTTKKTSHYGLAFDYYTHFTSPIRRYPDLMAHRLLFSYLHKGKSPSEAFYEEKCKHSSEREVQAADAERASVKYKQVEYIQQFIGEEFTGIISGVSEWGMYVEITDYKCEGMIRLTSLQDDYYEFDDGNMWLIGKRTKKIYQLGDAVQVKVKNADTTKRQIDLELAGIVHIRKYMDRNEKRKGKKKEEKQKKLKHKRRK
ncbi:MAG: ribonuclease R [Bacteroidota bacterium]